MDYKVRLFEITLKNLYSQISKEKKKQLTLEDLSKLKILDPTSKLKKSDVASSYLHWIIKDYFDRYKYISIEKYIQIVKDDIPLIIKKYHNYRNKGLVSSADLATYTYQTLVNELNELEEEYGIEVYNMPIENKDYVILNKNNDYEIYEALNAEGVAFLGKYSTWCIAKRKSFFADTFYRKQEGGKTFIIKSLREINSLDQYSNQCEYYCITIMPDGSVDEMVNAKNESMLYTDKEDKLLDLIKDYV